MEPLFLVLSGVTSVSVERMCTGVKTGVCWHRRVHEVLWTDIGSLENVYSFLDRKKMTNGNGRIKIEWTLEQSTA